MQKDDRFQVVVWHLVPHTIVRHFDPGRYLTSYSHNFKINVYIKCNITTYCYSEKSFLIMQYLIVMIVH